VTDERRTGDPPRDKRGQRRKPLSNDSINKTLVTLCQIFDRRLSGLLASHPASGRRRWPKPAKPQRRVLEADELKDLLSVAAEIDRTARRLGMPAGFV
jgi:hypothetical protein